MGIKVYTANEGSNIVLELSFFDASGNAVTPSSAKWSLLDKSNAIVNERRDVEIAPAEVATVVLYGDDLPEASKTGDYLSFVVTAYYTESGVSNVPEVEQVRILVNDIPQEATE